ncbi:MAG: hypothetical protein ACPF9D_11240 [Owenweeksia sp.]
MKAQILSVLFLIPTLGLFAQVDSLDAHSFDFWTGDWEVSWTNQQGQVVKGRNQINRILKDKVIQENFSDPNTGYEGKSWSTYSPQTQSWHQTWVDNGGGYLELDGERYGDTLAFIMDPQMINGTATVKRMIFYNITKKSFTWDWQSAPSGTEQWSLLWRINYKRKD